jgi:hypothetical protein
MMMIRKPLALALLVAAAALAGDGHAAAQTASGANDALKRQVERRFDVLPLRDGLALRPRATIRGVRSIEIAGGAIAINGTAATGADVREKLGADADVVLRLSYLEPEARRALFGGPDDAKPAPPAAAGEPPDAPEPPSPPPPARTRRSDARVRIGGSVTVDADESVEDVVVIGGSAHVMGQVEGDVVVIGGTADLGPHADIGKDVTVVGGSLNRAAGAHVGGHINDQVGPGFGMRGLHPIRLPRSFFFGSSLGGLFAFASTLFYLAIVSLFAFLVVLTNREYVERVAARAAAEPLKAGAVGLLVQLLFIPLLVVTIVLLVVTIIGIPLLVLVPFAILALVVFCFVGFTSVAYRIGWAVTGRRGVTMNPQMTAVIGIMIVMSPLIAGRVLGVGGPILLPLTLPVLFIGFVAEYLAWTVGVGAVALNRFAK